MDKTTMSQQTNRLQKPLLRLLSILAVIFSIGLFLLGLCDGVFIIPLSILAIFLMLWRFPIFWTWIEELFSKRPQTKWGRFSMNLVIAAFLAVLLEDVLDFITRGLFVLLRFIWQQ